MADRCPNCAAAVAEPNQVYCAFCGHALPREPPPVAPRPPAVGELLAEVERHPELAAWMAHTPSTTGLAVGLGVMMVFGLVFAAIAVVMMMLVAVLAPPFALFGLLFVAAGLGMAITAGVKASRLASAPLVRVPALVVDERTEVSGGGDDSSASTDYYATLEAADGRREEYPLDGRLAGAIAAGDYGLAYLRGGILLDFRRVGSR